MEIDTPFIYRVQFQVRFGFFWWGKWVLVFGFKGVVVGRNYERHVTSRNRSVRTVLVLSSEWAMIDFNLKEF